ncbi:MAG: protein tyrosine phosphatase family protein [Kangiellaceae bacterium]|nr:protein tyrosine phosphatase family protein [Kangiellaceae bacterium]
MKKLKSFFFGIIGFTLMSFSTFAFDLNKSLHEIKNFRFVSDKFASAGMIDLKQYSHIKEYGFKHVINLIPGMQLKERRHVESLGMTYEQIPVDWGNPKLADFEKFVDFMKSYGDEKVFVHCQLNWRASSFVYLYRVTQLGVSQKEAKTDLKAIWKPHDGWDKYIKEVIQAYQK